MVGVVYRKSSGKIVFIASDVNPEAFRQTYEDEVNGVLLTEKFDWKATAVRNGTSLSPQKPSIAKIRSDSASHAIIRFIGLGDVVMSIPAVELLKRNYPDANITYYTSEGGKRLLRNLKFIDSIITISPTPKTKKPGVEKEIPIPKGVGAHDYYHNFIDAVDFKPIVYRRPRADNFLFLLAEAGFPCEVPEDYLIPELNMTESERERYSAYEDKVFIQLSSHGDQRKYAHFLEVVETLPKAQFVLLSDDPAHENLKVPKNAENLSCKTTVEEFINICASSKLGICTDTSGMHICAMARKPCIILAGSTKVEWHLKYYPQELFHTVYSKPKLPCSPCWDWQKRHDCYKKRKAPWCLNRIKPLQIKNEIEQILEAMK